MKNITIFNAGKYQEGNYVKIADGIYENNGLFVSSLAFEQEPEFGEGDSSATISQYPLEDILDKFYVHISDFYNELNQNSSAICYQEFASSQLEDIKDLHSIIGKHVSNRTINVDGQDRIKFVIE